MRTIARLITTSFILVVGSALAADERLGITSPAFATEQNIPAEFTCKGANVNPALRFRGVPVEAKSLALVVEDPDAPSGLFTHWLIWNILPTATAIGEKSVPAGAVQGTNDFGNLGYGGPCPPSGTHRYVFKLLALDEPLELKPGSRRSEFNKAIANHVIGRAEITGRFGVR
jgi:hypothetical protein